VLENNAWHDNMPGVKRSMTKFTIKANFKILKAVQEGVSGNGRKSSRKTLSLPVQPFLF